MQLSVTQATSAIVSGVQLAIVDDFTKLQAATHTTGIVGLPFIALMHIYLTIKRLQVWLTGSALCDITIASLMSYYVRYSVANSKIY